MKRHAALIPALPRTSPGPQAGQTRTLRCRFRLPEAIKQSRRDGARAISQHPEGHFAMRKKACWPNWPPSDRRRWSSAPGRTCRLRALNDSLSSPDRAVMDSFATLLHDHVRFEERELFETAQALLTRSTDPGNCHPVLLRERRGLYWNPDLLGLPGLMDTASPAVDEFGTLIDVLLAGDHAAALAETQR